MFDDIYLYLLEKFDFLIGGVMWVSQPNILIIDLCSNNTELRAYIYIFLHLCK